MKPSAFRIERLLANVEAEVERRGLRARRYVFHPDEVAEAEAQGLPYVLLPRVLSSREWMERYGKQPAADPGTAQLATTSDRTARRRHLLTQAHWHSARRVLMTMADPISGACRGMARCCGDCATLRTINRCVEKPSQKRVS